MPETNRTTTMDLRLGKEEVSHHSSSAIGLLALILFLFLLVLFCSPCICDVYPSIKYSVFHVFPKKSLICWVSSNSMCFYFEKLRDFEILGYFEILVKVKKIWVNLVI